ncbi:hypothetical protein BJ742DRAFT_338355 [Cladochytrium replicatum]|nr:hypothetical protein BJ742DRAFT_338355 [Cladochytrium replicatum]
MLLTPMILAQLIMEQVITSTIGVLAVSDAALNIVLRNPDIVRALTTTEVPVIMRNRTDAFREVVNAMRTQPIHNGVFCGATENFTGVINPNRKFFTNTPPPQIGVYKITGITMVAFMDDSIGWKYAFTPWNDNGPPGPPILTILPFAPPTNYSSSWEATSYMDVQGTLLWQFTHLGYYYPNDHDRTLGVIPSFGCAISIEVQTSFSKFIEALSSTFANGTRIFLFEKDSGLLVTADNAAAIADGNSRFVANSTTDLTISSLVSAMQQSAQQSSQFETQSSSLERTTMTLYGIDSQGSSALYLVRAHLLTEFGTNWIAVVAIPYKGIFGVVDQLHFRAIVIATVLSAAGLTVTVLLACFTVRPLIYLSRATRKLTKLDFSVLEKKTMDGRSRITEINVLQETFITMVRAFAVFLKMNRAITTGKFTHQSSTVN